MRMISGTDQKARTACNGVRSASQKEPRKSRPSTGGSARAWGAGALEVTATVLNGGVLPWRGERSSSGSDVGVIIAAPPILLKPNRTHTLDHDRKAESVMMGQEARSPGLRSEEHA